MMNILFIPLDAVGHVNSAIGMAQVLAQSGHKAIFAITDQWRGKLERYGFGCPKRYFLKFFEKLSRNYPRNFLFKIQGMASKKCCSV